MNQQCKFCVHSDVCAYKDHYKDVVELYEKTRGECSKYPYFVCDIRCIKYLKKVESQESEVKSCSDCKYWLLDKNDERRRCKYCFEMDEWVRKERKIPQ